MDGAGAQWRHLHGYCFICMGEMQTKQLRKKLKKKKKKKVSSTPKQSQSSWSPRL